MKSFVLVIVTTAGCWEAASARVIGRVSVSSTGAQANAPSQPWQAPSLSSDGRFVAFSCIATNLVPGDTNGVHDIFVHDRRTGQTTRVSIRTNGVQGNGSSTWPSISADGRFVAFQSKARYLVGGDTNVRSDIFVHDRQAGETTRVSIKSTGRQGNGGSYRPSISADGRFVAFESFATNLVRGDTNGREDVFVHDRQTGRTTRVSIRSTGRQGNGDSSGPSISADGRFVAFQSEATNLVRGDENGMEDVFVHDRNTGRTTRVSVSVSGREGTSSSHTASISADGRFVAFSSYANNLVHGDTNGKLDIFVHDRQMGATTRVSVSGYGHEGNSSSEHPSLSADGRFVAFSSHASNLVHGDTNGRGDVFVHDRHTGQIVRASVSGSGGEGNDRSCHPSISADGRFVGFESGASDLVAGDTNGKWDMFVAGNSRLLPTLSWLGVPGFASDGVHPNAGQAWDTPFTFKVLYADARGDAPKHVSLHLRRNGKLFRKLTMARGAGDYVNGRTYRLKRKLPAGDYEHRFMARDRDGPAIGEATHWTPGPTVQPKMIVLLTTVSAVPTNAGTQITFGLSSAAQVQARILNIAGRPVKTLCHAKDCDAGTNTLLWNAQSDSGLAVPRGMYLVEVMARGDDGAQTRALTQVRLNR